MDWPPLGRDCLPIGRSDRYGTDVQWTGQGSEGLMAPLDDQGAHAVCTAGIESHQSDDSVPPRYGLKRAADSDQIKRLNGEMVRSAGNQTFAEVGISALRVQRG